MSKGKTSVDNYAFTMNRRFTMKYTLEERLDIGRRIYDGEITKYAAAEQFGISINCARDYMRLYRDTNSLPPKQNSRNSHVAPSFSKEAAGMEEFQNMTKEELIQELVKARITEARLKKGYEVKGDGTVILYDSRNTK